MATNNPFYVAPPNVFQALLAGVDGYNQGRTRASEAARDEARLAAQSAMESGGDTRSAIARLLSVGDTAGANAIASVEDRTANREWRQTEAERSQRNADRAFALQQSAAARSDRHHADAMKVRDVPSGFQRNPDGSLAFIPGGPADPEYKRKVGDRQNAPPGYQWNDPTNPSAGMRPIPGGPGEKVDAEVAARLGLAKSFLGQVPDIRRDVQAGGATGPLDWAVGKAGFGRAGELHRQIASGAEALLRNLTGAGMNIAEAQEYANRYRPTYKDNSETLTSKLDQLKKELESVGEVVGRGRGGFNGAANGAATQAAPQISEGVTATNQQTGQKIIFRNGQWVPIQ